MSAKHTPGPWEWMNYSRMVGSDYKEVIRATDTAYEGAQVEIDNPADIALIAAAPELLAALQAALTEIILAKQADAASWGQSPEKSWEHAQNHHLVLKIRAAIQKATT